MIEPVLRSVRDSPLRPPDGTARPSHSRVQVLGLSWEGQEEQQAMRAVFPGAAPNPLNATDVHIRRQRMPDGFRGFLSKTIGGRFGLREAAPPTDEEIIDRRGLDTSVCFQKSMVEVLPRNQCPFDRANPALQRGAAIGDSTASRSRSRARVDAIGDSTAPLAI